MFLIPILFISIILVQTVIVVYYAVNKMYIEHDKKITAAIAKKYNEIYIFMKRYESIFDLKFTKNIRKKMIGNGFEFNDDNTLRRYSDDCKIIFSCDINIVRKNGDTIPY